MFPATQNAYAPVAFRFRDNKAFLVKLFIAETIFSRF